MTNHNYEKSLEKFLELAEQREHDVQDVYFLSNTNGELLNFQDQNLLDSKTFPVHFINEINQKILQIPGERISYEEKEIPSSLFLDRLESLIILFANQGFRKETKFLTGIIQTITYLNVNSLVVTKKPNLFSKEGEDLEEILHPNVLKIPLVRRALSGFVIFREIPRSNILELFQKASKTPVST